MKLEHLGRIACQMAAKELEERAAEQLGPGGRLCHFSPCHFPNCGCLKACSIHLHHQIECLDCQDANMQVSQRAISVDESACTGKVSWTILQADADIHIPLTSTAEAIRLICEEGYVFSGTVRVLQVPGDSQGGFGLEPLPAESGAVEDVDGCLVDRRLLSTLHRKSSEPESGLLNPGRTLSPEELDTAFLKIRTGHRATIDQAALVESAIFDLIEAVIRAEIRAGIYRHDVDPLRMRGTLTDGNQPEEPEYPEESTDVLATRNFIETTERWQ